MSSNKPVMAMKIRSRDTNTGCKYSFQKSFESYKISLQTYQHTDYFIFSERLEIPAICLLLSIQTHCCEILNP